MAFPLHGSRDGGVRGVDRSRQCRAIDRSNGSATLPVKCANLAGNTPVCDSHTVMWSGDHTRWSGGVEPRAGVVPKTGFVHAPLLPEIPDRAVARVLDLEDESANRRVLAQA